MERNRSGHSNGSLQQLRREIFNNDESDKRTVDKRILLRREMLETIPWQAQLGFSRQSTVLIPVSRPDAPICDNWGVFLYPIMPPTSTSSKINSSNLIFRAPSIS